MFDLLITNARIIDGTGNPWRRADLAVKDGRIAQIGRIDPVGAEKVIDAQDRFLTPGFVDGHSHSDLEIFASPESLPKIMQGVTTENVGLDGLSVAPISADNIPGWRKHLAGLAGDPKIEWNWRSLGEYFDALDQLRPALNVSSYVGLGTIRLDVMGMTDRPASPDEIRAMQDLTARAMEEGARGISAGLIYPPSSYQSLEETVALAEIAARYQGVYDVHMRNEADRIDEAIEEVLEIGRRSGIPIMITHFKIRGQTNWGRSEELLARLDRARAEGIDVTTAVYPYTAGSTILHAVIPPWRHKQGPEGLLRDLRDDREEVKREIRERKDWENFAASVGWENIYVSSVRSEANQVCEGKNLVQIAELRGAPGPDDAAMDLLIEEDLAVGMIAFGLSEADVKNNLGGPTTSFITDGLLGGGKPHPRAYGTYPRILGRYVREEKLMSLEEAVRKMTGLPAAKIRLPRKGLLLEGYDADLVVFDPQTVAETGTYDDPRRFPTGIDHVVVNGEVVVEKGRPTGARPGRSVRG